jgi:hypothetical protein
MSGLEPPKDAELNQALLDDSFGADLLARAGSVFPRQQFYMTIFWNQPDNRLIVDILDWLGGRGPPEIEMFLQGAVVVQPDCPNVKAFCARYFPNLQPLAPNIASRIGNFGLIQEVNLGLKLLSEHSDAIDFSSTLGEFRATLQETGRQIQLLKKYKGLHNSLHNLQGQLLGIEATVALVRSGGAVKGLRKIAFNLKPLAGDARAQTTGLPRPAREIEWIDEFDSYIALMMNTALLAAPTVPEINKVSDVPNLLRALLHQEAPRINDLLVAAADALRLKSFAETMETIANKIRLNVSKTDSVLKQLIDSAAAVKGLEARLKALVDQHYDWQDLNTALDEAEASTRHQPQHRITKWDRFRKRLEDLCGRYPNEEWSRTIIGLMAAWIAATPATNPGDAESIAGDTAFDAFCRACVSRFVNVDTELNELSDEVTNVARPLDALLSQIPRA